MTDEQLYFEVITADEFYVAQAQPSKSKLVTEPRNFATWFALPTGLGFCTVPSHDEIQQMLKPEQQAIRQKYPSRMVVRLGDINVCRDCYLAEADKG